MSGNVSQWPLPVIVAATPLCFGIADVMGRETRKNVGGTRSLVGRLPAIYDECRFCPVPSPSTPGILDYGVM